MTATQKKQRKMLSSFTILFLITVFVAVLSWIVPAGQYNLDGDNYIAGTYHVVDATRQGIWDVLTAPITGMIGNDATPGAIEVALFVMVVGGFLGVVTATGAIDAGIASVIRNNRDNVGALIWGLMFIFALGGATYGMAEENDGLLPIAHSDYDSSWHGFASSSSRCVGRIGLRRFVVDRQSVCYQYCFRYRWHHRS